MLDWHAVNWDRIRTFLIIGDKIDDAVRSEVLGSFATLGAHSEYSVALLGSIVPEEADSEWKEDLIAVASNWSRRVLAVNLGVHRAEVNDLIRETGGRVLTDWDVSNPKAYAHYQRSMELQLQGKIHEAIAEVARAAELDPLDPANHFTLGSVKSEIGAKQGDAALVRGSGGVLARGHPRPNVDSALVGNRVYFTLKRQAD